MAYSLTDRRWVKAAGFLDISHLSDQEAEEFDTLCFMKHGPDQVTYSDKNEARWNELAAIACCPDEGCPHYGTIHSHPK